MAGDFREERTYGGDRGWRHHHHRGNQVPVEKSGRKVIGGRVRWISPFRLVRVHWLPGNVPDVCIHNFLSQFVPVASILPERATDGFENGVRRAKFGSDGIEKIPHLSKIEYEGMEFPVLITVPGRPPLCLTCHSTGHVRYECDAKSQVGLWAAKVGGARAGSFANVEIEEEGETEVERKEKMEVERRKKREAQEKKRGARKRWLELVPWWPVPHLDTPLHPTGEAPGGAAGGLCQQRHKSIGHSWYTKASP